MFLYILCRQIICFFLSSLFQADNPEGFLQFLMGNCFELSCQIFSKHMDIANARKAILTLNATICVSLLVKSGDKP